MKLSKSITEARYTLLVSLHQPFKLSGDFFYIDLVDPLDKAGECPTMSSEDLPIELTCLSMVLNSTFETVLEDLTPLWDFLS